MEEKVEITVDDSPSRKNIFKKIRFRRNKNDPSSPSFSKNRRGRGSSSSPGSNGKDGGGSSGGRSRKGNGRFKKKNSLDSSSGSSTSEKSKTNAASSNNNTTAMTIPEDSAVLQTRRVIKASRSIPTQPYPPSTPSSSSSTTTNTNTNTPSIASLDYETTDTNSTTTASTTASSTYDKIQIRGGTNHILLPSVQDENLREKTEQWRKERLDATVAIRKENKEKDVMEHRRNNSISSVDEVKNTLGDKKDVGNRSNDAKGGVVVPDEIEVSEIFKTRTFHPEHKRKVDDDNNCHQDSEKKLKIDDSAGDKNDVGNDDYDDDSDDGKDTDYLKFSVEMPAWIAPVTVVAACACAFAFVMMKSIRKR